MKSWNGAVSSVAPAMARSTCASPSTSRRTFMPASWAGSDIEEDGLVGLGHQRMAAVGGDAVRHGGLLEADARDEPVQQPAREHVDGEERGGRRGDAPCAIEIGGRAGQLPRSRFPRLL